MAPRQKLSYVDDAASVGRRLRAAREQAGMSQRALSFPGCTAAYISRIENGERIPSLQLLREFASKLGVAEQFLAYGREDGPAPRRAPTDARVAIRMGDFDGARAMANALLEEAHSHADRAAAFALLGEVALGEGDLDTARATLEHAISLDGNLEERDPDVAESLGRLYARAYEHESAVAVFRRSLERALQAKDPINQVRFASLLANALVDSGNFSGAEEVLATAIATSEAASDPLAVARLYWAQSMPDRALALLETSDQHFHAARAYQLLAHIELDRGNGERAAALLEQASPIIVASGRKFELACFRIEQARALLTAGRLDEARAIAMDAAASMAGQSAVDAGRSYALLADVFVSLGDDERAIELYELAVERLDETPNRYAVEAYSKLAALHERRGDQVAMIETLKRGLNVQSQAERLLAEH